MDNKIIIEIQVPQLETSYDLFIPINLTIYDVTRLIIDSICDITEGAFISNPKMRLYNKNTGQEIDVNLIVKQSSLRNGSQVILI